MFLSQDYKREIVFIFVYKTFTFWNSDTCVSGGISLGKMIFPQKVSFVSDPPCTPSALTWKSISVANFGRSFYDQKWRFIRIDMMIWLVLKRTLKVFFIFVWKPNFIFLATKNALNGDLIIKSPFRAFLIARNIKLGFQTKMKKTLVCCSSFTIW